MLDAIIAILTFASLPFRGIWGFAKGVFREVGILKLRWGQWRNPSQFLTLKIAHVEFNPTPQLEGEPDCLEISLSITSGLLTDLHLQSLEGVVYTDSSSLSNKFELHRHPLTIRRTGQLTEWEQQRVTLSQETRAYLSGVRARDDKVRVGVSLTGHRDRGRFITLEAFTEKLSVLP